MCVLTLDGDRPSELHETHLGHLHCALGSQICTMGASLTPDGELLPLS